MTIYRLPWPEWVEAWLRLPFYRIKCRIHPNKYSTVYCTACEEEPICEICWKDTSRLHSCRHHRVIQVCIASKRPAIPIRHAREFIDISEIQDYVINNKEIVFLNPHKEGVPDCRYTPNCQTCQRKLKPDGGRQTGYKFCCIACKIGSTEGGDLEIERESDDPQELIVSRPKLKIIYGRKTMKNGADQSSAVSFRKRSRKGIPHRAPFK